MNNTTAQWPLELSKIPSMIYLIYTCTKGMPCGGSQLSRAIIFNKEAEGGSSRCTLFILPLRYHEPCLTLQPSRHSAFDNDIS